MLLKEPQDLTRLRPTASHSVMSQCGKRLAKCLPKIIPGLDLNQFDEQRLEQIVHRFTLNDLRTAQLALWLEANPVWLETDDVNEMTWVIDDPRISAPYFAYGLHVAMTWLQQQGARRADMVESAIISEHGVRAQTFHGELAHLLPQRFSAIDEVNGARLSGIFNGLRLHKNPGSELAKRILRLPGWRGTSICPAEGIDQDLQRGHVTSLKNWRLQAVEVFHDLGVLEPSQGQIDQLCCAISGASNWHHLRQAYLKAALDPRSMGVWRTCELLNPEELDQSAYAYMDVKRLRVEHETYHGTFESAFDRVIQSSQAMSVFSPEWKNLEINVNAYWSGVRHIIIRPEQAAGGPNLGTHMTAWYMSRVDEVDPHHYVNGKIHDLVRKTWVPGATLDVGIFKKIFPVQEIEEQADFADQLLGWKPFVEVGQVRIYAAQVENEPGLVCAKMHSTHGVSYRGPDETSGATIRNCAIVTDPVLGLPVLVCSSPSGGPRLMAVLYHWPKQILKKLMSALKPDMDQHGQSMFKDLSGHGRKNWESDVQAWIDEGGYMLSLDANERIKDGYSYKPSSQIANLCLVS